MPTTFGSSDNGCGRCCQKFCGVIRRNLLVVLLGMGAAVGFLIGAVINPTVQDIENPETKATTTMLIGFPGELLMNMLQVIILPLIVASLITAVSHLDARATGKIGRRALLFYLTTTLSAAILGMVLVSSIRPGKTDSPTGSKSNPNPYTTRDSFLDLIRSCFPSNLVEATFRQKKTYYRTDPGKYEFRNVTGTSPKLEENEKIFEVIMVNATLNITTISKEIYPSSKTIFAGVKTNPTGGMNILGLAVFSIVFGVVLGKMGIRAKPLTAFFSSLNDAVMILVTLIMCAATLPTTIRCLEENNKVDPRISKFVLPLGATVNMDGAALYEAIAAIFIAQLNDYDLSGGKIVAICLTATAIAIGAAGIPSAGSITTIIVLQAVGLPLDDIGLIMAVDWFLDRFRTTVNVLGDSIGAGVVEHLSREDLLKYDVNGRMDDHAPLSNGLKLDDPDQVVVTSSL
ncbi:Excitatory amino acid transporter 3 [Stylophora pistillata]|uniref:Amino acid transporter n=2 Tax=Stylophora pistillata TaxID=50429 RepID=A0A2B4STR2_STYPI|nr:Excitatory amino acid transporter 3 [Stylophora pistillata]